MGGKRIAEQVRRALVAAAKVAPVAVAIDATGCGDDWPCATPPCDQDPWNPCPVLAPDAGRDAAVSDAGKDGD